MKDTKKISYEDIKVRKRHAPGVRVIKSEKDKERKPKHKKNLVLNTDEED